MLLLGFLYCQVHIDLELYVMENRSCAKHQLMQSVCAAAVCTAVNVVCHSSNAVFCILNLAGFNCYSVFRIILF